MSETTNLKLKKHDNPSTNEEKFDIENYLNGNWDKVDENVGKTNTEISNVKAKNTEQDSKIVILQNEKEELENELKEVKEDNYQNSIRGQASGEYIHVEDSSNCRAKIGIGGNSKQETRSGKNYLNTLAKYKAGEKVTVDGITYIFNEDGSITCNGTATADSVLTFSSNLQTINGSGKKIVGMITGTQVPKKLNILAYTSDWSKNTFTLLSNVNKNITTNMQENIDYTIFRIIVYKETTLNNQTIYYQILDTSVNDLTYEQYGASPSSDYQSEVKSVGSNVNIYDKETMPLKSGLWIGSTPDSNITTNSRGNYVVVPIVGGKTYTISKKNATGTIYATTIASNAENGVKVIDRWDGNSGLKSYTIKTSSTAKYLFVGLFAGTPSEEEKEKCIEELKVEKGTVATPYSKYGQGCVKVTKCNKNLAIKNVKGYFNISDFKIKIDNNSEAFLFYAEKGKEYTRSCKVNLDRNRIGKIDTLDVTQGMTVLNGQEINSKKFICDDSGIYIWFVNSTLNDSIKESFQIEEGSTDTEYVQHEGQSYIMPTQQPMRSIGDIRDTFIKKDGKWYERHNIYRYLFTGNENFKELDNNSIFGMIVTENKAKIVSKNDNGNLTYCLSNRFMSSTQLNIAKVDNGIAFSQWSDTQYLYLSKFKDSIDELKKYLAENETYVDYPLETPIDIECTSEQSAVLEKLNNARTYKNITNLYSTNEVSAILSLDYAKDLEILLNNVQALALNNASEGV